MSRSSCPELWSLSRSLPHVASNSPVVAAALPSRLTLTRVPLFSLQGPATSAGPTTARAGARRLPCWCAPGSPASQARSRSSTPTEPGPGTGPARLARVCWTTTTDKEFSIAFSQERDGGRPQGGREVKGGAKPPGRAWQRRAL